MRGGGGERDIDRLRISSAMMFVDDVLRSGGWIFYGDVATRGGQFGELRRRGSLIDDEEQLVRRLFTAMQGWSLSLLSRPECYCSVNPRRSPWYRSVFSTRE